MSQTKAKSLIFEVLSAIAPEADLGNLRGEGIGPSLRRSGFQWFFGLQDLRTQPGRRHGSVSRLLLQPATTAEPLHGLHVLRRQTRRCA